MVFIGVVIVSARLPWSLRPCGDFPRGPALSAIPRNPLLAPFQVRSFRFLWPAELATSWALEMESLILGWYVLVESGSVTLLAVFGALMYFGALVSPVFGLLGDRVGYRNLLCATRAGSALLALTLMTLAFSGLLNATLVLIIATLVSVVRVSDLVTRYALSGEIMPPGVLMGAMGISRANVDSARVAGALAGAGMVAAYGIGPAYVVIVSFYSASFLLTLGVTEGRRKSGARGRAGSGTDAAAASTPTVSPWRDLREAFAYVRTQPALLAATCLAFLVNLTAYPVFFGLLPYVAKNVYAVGQTDLGYMAASLGFGSLIGSMLLSATGVAARTARVMLIAGMLWYALLLLFAHVQSLPLGIAVLMLSGMMQSICVTPIAVVMLRCAGAKFRGRVMGLRMLMIYGLPIGLVAIGPLIDRFGFAATATAYALAGLLLLLAIAVRWSAAVWRLDAPPNVPADVPADVPSGVSNIAR